MERGKTKMLTGSEIAAFVAEQRELCTNATPGPWHEGVNGNPRVYGPDDSLGSGLIAAFTRWQDRPFIASARTSLPRALDIIEEQQQRIAELERGKAEARKERRGAAGGEGVRA